LKRKNDPNEILPALRNWRTAKMSFSIELRDREKKLTNPEDRSFAQTGACLVGSEEFETAVCLLQRETVLVAFEELEDVLHDEHLEADLFLVVEVLSLFISLSSFIRL
jgi:hypothetical protein